MNFTYFVQNCVKSVRQFLTLQGLMNYAFWSVPQLPPEYFLQSLYRWVASATKYAF